MQPHRRPGTTLLSVLASALLLASTGPAFAFRDPFGAVWDVHPHAR